MNPIEFGPYIIIGKTEIFSATFLVGVIIDVAKMNIFRLFGRLLKLSANYLPLSTKRIGIIKILIRDIET